MNADASVARKALEQVRARGDLELAQECYAADFVDHVNALDLHGHDGIRRSTDVYRALFDDLRIRVVDQITEGDRVVSRWVMTGSNRGRPAEMSASRSAAWRPAGLSKTEAPSTASSCCASSGSFARCSPHRDCCARRTPSRLAGAPAARCW
jgi:hypothetical protein